MRKKITKQYIHEHFEKLFFNKENIKTDESFVKEILHDHLSFVPNKKLYKFRTCNDENFSTLEAGTIWMSKPDEFHDIFDCTINVDLKRNGNKIINWFKNNNVEIALHFLNEASKQQDIPFDIDVEYVKEIANNCISPSGKMIKSKTEAYISHSNVQKRGAAILMPT